MEAPRKATLLVLLLLQGKNYKKQGRMSQIYCKVLSLILQN